MENPAVAVPRGKTSALFAECDVTLWLFIRLIIARVLAFVPTAVFESDLGRIFAAVGWQPQVTAAAAAAKPAPGLLALSVLTMAVAALAPFVWVWPIGRYLDTDDEPKRPAALRRFAGMTRFFVAYYAVETLYYVGSGLALRGTGAPLAAEGSVWAFCAYNVFASYYGAYFTLLILEPILFKDLASSLYPDERAFEAKQAPVWSIRTKLLLLVANLIVVPMALVGASMKLGLNGYSGGLGVAVMTAIVAIGYTEMLYRGLARPLEQLNEKMGGVSSGDYSAKSPVLANDELGELTLRFNEMVDGLAERERLKDTFGRFVSVEIAKRLIEKEVALGGESIEATVLFSDIRDFTPLSESLSPQELVSFLNDYFSFITEPIARHHGVVNKFIGDAVMAIFAPQFGSEDHAADALAAAREMRAKLAEFNAKRSGPPVRFGVGIHSGPLVAGNIGTSKRMEYTVIGDTVNVAARIEAATKDLGCDVLISESVYQRLGDASRLHASGQRCEGVRVKGKEAALVLYKIG